MQKRQLQPLCAQDTWNAPVHPISIPQTDPKILQPAEQLCPGCETGLGGGGERNMGCPIRKLGIP